MLAPALALIGAALVHLPLSPRSLVRAASASPAPASPTSRPSASPALAMAVVVFRRSSPLRPRREDWRLEWRLFREILRVGAISSLSALQTVLTAVILTGFVGRYGAAALAGYGVGVRLELLQIPLVFAVGQALVVLVGTHIGAGRAERAKRIAWVGAALAASISLAIGVARRARSRSPGSASSAADAAVLESGARYLRIVAPFYPLLAAGIALYFASQGAGRVLRPVLAGTARLAHRDRRRRSPPLRCRASSSSSPLP